MSALGDGEEEMFARHDASDALIDAVLSNKAVPGGDAALGALLSDIVAVADSAAPRASTALAEVLSGTVAIVPTGAAPARRRRARKIATRAAGVGVATKLWLGAVAAGAALTAAVGVSHNLPGPAQRIFEDVVNRVTPWTVTHHHSPSTSPSAPVQPPRGGASAPGRPPSTPPGLTTYPPRPVSVPPPPVSSSGRPTSPPNSSAHPTPPSHRGSTPPSSSHSGSPVPPAPPTSPNQH